MIFFYHFARKDINVCCVKYGALRYLIKTLKTSPNQPRLSVELILDMAVDVCS